MHQKEGPVQFDGSQAACESACRNGDRFTERLDLSNLAMHRSDV